MTAKDFENAKPFDIWNEDIKGNCAVFGQYGSGKTFLLKKRIARFLKNLSSNERVYIIGHGEEFKALVSLFDSSKTIDCITGHYDTDKQVVLISTEKIYDTPNYCAILAMATKLLSYEIFKNSEKGIRSHVFLSDFYCPDEYEDLDRAVFNLKDPRLNCDYWVVYGNIDMFFMPDKTVEKYTFRRAILKDIDNLVILDMPIMEEKYYSKIFDIDEATAKSCLGYKKVGEGYLKTKDNLYKIQFKE